VYDLSRVGNEINYVIRDQFRAELAAVAVAGLDDRG
jgi:hypothetical protein